MSSPQVIDSASRTRQLAQFFKQRTAEKHDNAQKSAQERADEVYKGKDAGYDVTSLQAQMGRPLSRDVIIARLRKMNAQLVFEQSINYPTQGGVYIIDPTANRDDLSERNRGRRFLVGFEWGISTEFSVTTPHKDEHGTPSSATIRKGWRAVLASLIKSRAITIEQAEKGFQISRGRESEKWWNTLQ